VVHIAYDDALAYAKWLGRSLPTEAQWEFAARGGRDGEDDWSSAFDPEGKPIANTWQGIFPVLNTNDDGYAETAPVGCFPPNGYGLYDMIGNVWEWTSDWYRFESPENNGNQSGGARTDQPSHGVRANAEPRHQRRLVFVLHERLFSLSPCRKAAPGKRSCGCTSGVSHGAQQAESLTPELVIVRPADLSRR
jgi:formylglycine-generating enzyme required for sulfatase activity